MKQLPENDDNVDANPYQAPVGIGADPESTVSVALTFADWMELLQTAVLFGFGIGSTLGLTAMVLATFGYWLLTSIVLLSGVWLVSVVIRRDYTACRRKRLDESQLLQRVQKADFFSETNS